MAGRRIAQTSINWSALAERVPPNQMPSFAAFKSKSDNYMRAVLANPENPPKIDWDQYQHLIPVKGLVDSFKKQYESLKVPYPADNVTAQVDSQAKETKANIDKFKCESEERICNFLHSPNVHSIPSIVQPSVLTPQKTSWITNLKISCLPPSTKQAGDCLRLARLIQEGCNGVLRY